MPVQGEYEVTAVAEDWVSDTAIWRVRFRRVDDGPGPPEREHIFPKMALDARAAEYGIDPEDVDTLLDVIFHEPYIIDPADPRNHADDPAAKKGMTVRQRFPKGRLRAGDHVPAWLFNADSTEQARQAHLERIRHCKDTGRFKVRPPAPGARAADPLDVIRQSHVPDHERIAAIRDNTEQLRRHERGETPGQRRRGGKPR